jgi:hypothetical protein
VTVPSLKRIFKLGLPRHLDNNNNNNDGMNLCASLHLTLNRRLSLADHWRKRRQTGQTTRLPRIQSLYRVQAAAGVRIRALSLLLFC